MEQEEFKKSILPLRNQLLSYAVHILEDPEEAADITQEVFLKLWHMREELARYESVPALATRITKHLCLNRIKVRNREWDTDRIDTHENRNPYLQLEQKDSLEHVIRIIDQLPGLQQSILRMKHVEELEIDEISEITGATPEAIRMNLSRARKRVKEIFFKMQS